MASPPSLTCSWHICGAHHLSPGGIAPESQTVSRGGGTCSNHFKLQHNPPHAAEWFVILNDSHKLAATNTLNTPLTPTTNNDVAHDQLIPPTPSKMHETRQPRDSWRPETVLSDRSHPTWAWLTTIVGKIPVLSGIRRIPERTGILAIIIVVVLQIL